MRDHHADTRDAKRQKERYGHVTTNPGLRVVQRELAARPKPVYTSRQNGERIASRVRVQASQGSSYDGKVGVLADIRHGTYFVRFGRDERPLPFDPSEVVVL